MKLNKNILNNLENLMKKGYSVPEYDRQTVSAATKEAPDWVHFGAGNIFRAFLANNTQLFLNQGKRSKGVVAVEGFDYDIIRKTYLPFDNLGLAAILNADGTVSKSLQGCITEALQADIHNIPDWARLKDIFRNPSLQMVSFTITEKGYNLVNNNGSYFELVKADFAAGPEQPESYMGKVAALLYHRYQNGCHPVTLVSMDNCSKNGSKLQTAVMAYVHQWTAAGLCEHGFLEYLENPLKVGFPWTMIDKITPRPDKNVQKLFEEDGFEAIAPVITEQNTYAAPFVNAEQPQYLVMEDWFPAGKPLPAEAGIFYTDREQVSKTETMKVTTCLNPLHTALAIFGCLLNYRLISDEMKDPDLKNMVYRLGYQEGLPVVVTPDIISPEKFIKEVLTERLPNPFMPDSPQRIATDTSQKLPIRFGETVKAYRERGLDVAVLQVIPLVYAGWLRYLLGIDDQGDNMEISADPRLAEMQERMKTVAFGSTADYHEVLVPILSDESIFGMDLYEAGIGARAEQFFHGMIAAPGAVRRIIQAAVSG